MQDWNSNWKASIKPKKQRKYVYNAPLHIKQKFVAAHLSKELKKKYGKRSLSIRKGDKVKVMRGQFSGKEGKVLKVNLKRARIFIEGIENIRKDGTKSLYQFQPSNLMLIELNLEDKERKQALEPAKEKK